MAINNWRKMPTPVATVLENPATMALIKETNEYNKKIEDVKNSSWNTNKDNIDNWHIFDAGHTMMITTPWWNILTWIFIDDPDINKRHFELYDIKRWGWPINVPYNIDNLKAFRELSNKQATWKYGRDVAEYLQPTPQIKKYVWEELVNIDDYINNQEKKLQNRFDKYINTFKLYQKASPKTQELVKPLMKRALDDYNDLKNNLYTNANK